MWVNTTHPANALLLRHYQSRDEPLIASPDSVADPYLHCGSHPDVVQRVWDDLGAVLPPDAKCLLFGTPALVLPVSGVVVAVCMGTQYGLRIPREFVSAALGAGATMVQRWSNGEQTDIQQLFGPDWVFGCYADQEREWCERVAEEHEPLSSP